jgi:thiamine-monophosphate kinase
MCCGRVPCGKALRRSTARPGDLVYVTGELGASALGLRQKRGAAWLRHKRPEPRIDAGISLRSIASAAMDLSDGISLDLLRLLAASQVRAVIDASIPLAKGATEEDGLHGGEDYELLFTARPDIKVPAMLGGARVTRIGLVERGKPAVRYHGRPLPPHGFDHFL